MEGLSILYENYKLVELREIAKERNVASITTYKKDELVEILNKLDKEAEQPEIEEVKEEIKEEIKEDKEIVTNKHSLVKSQEQKFDFDRDTTIETGVLEVVDGYGFLRMENFLPSVNDVYVPANQIRRFRLKTGDVIKCNVKKISESDDNKFRPLIYLQEINGDKPDVVFRRKNFEDLIPVYPNEKLNLEMGSDEISTRIIDLIAPIGKGQRGMIVAPPKSGKTVLLKKIANAITKNHKEVYLIVLLIDERPEEVTDIKRSINGENVDVIYSTFDELPEHHKRVAEIVLERAKRLVEHKKDVVILLDSITRLARAYNLIIPSSGRTLSGGLDPASLHMPKKFFGAARNIEDGGSLTILSTALVETGSKMDDVIFEEFKGTGNMELVLDRRIAQRRLFPCIDISKSGTRKDDLLLSKDELDANYNIYKAFGNKNSYDTLESVIDGMKNTKNNKEFVELAKKL